MYEIKPITQYQGNPDSSTNGMDQREGYIQALQDARREVNPDGNTFDPNGMLLTSVIHSDKYIKYYTYPDRPGMIYWGHVNRYEKEPYAKSKEKDQGKPQKEDNEDFFEGMREAVDIAAIFAAMLFVLKVIYGVLKFFASGDPSGIPAFGAITCK